jgi:hypothetical protein
MQEERWYDQVSDDYIAGLAYGLTYANKIESRRVNDELYMIQNPTTGWWFTIDTATALEWGL